MSLIKVKEKLHILPYNQDEAEPTVYTGYKKMFPDIEEPLIPAKSVFYAPRSAFSKRDRVINRVMQPAYKDEIKAIQIVNCCKLHMPLRVHVFRSLP